jgi:hypothetical protein
MPAENISHNLEGFGYNLINVRQMTATQRAPNGQTQMETLPLFLVTLTRNIKSKEIYKMNCLNHLIKVELFWGPTDLTQCYNCQNLAICGPTASNLLNVCKSHCWATASQKKSVPTEITELQWAVFSMCSVTRCYNKDSWSNESVVGYSPAGKNVTRGHC